LSGTGSQGATIRIYFEKYDAVNLDLETSDAISGLVKVAYMITKISEFTGRFEPTVSTN
jgi:phosphoglucomutase